MYARARVRVCVCVYVAARGGLFVRAASWPISLSTSTHTHTHTHTHTPLTARVMNSDGCVWGRGQASGLFQSPLVDSPLHDVDNVTAPCQVGNPGCHKLSKSGLPVNR